MHTVQNLANGTNLELMYQKPNSMLEPWQVFHCMSTTYCMDGEAAERLASGLKRKPNHYLRLTCMATMSSMQMVLQVLASMLEEARSLLKQSMN